MKNLDMRKLTRARLVAIACIVLVMVASCKSDKKFRENCKTKYLGCKDLHLASDTVQLSHHKICIFENGIVKAVGKMSNDKRKGDWYFYRQYSDTVECLMVVRYRNNDSAIVWSSSLINQSW